MIMYQLVKGNFLLNLLPLNIRYTSNKTGWFNGGGCFVQK